MNSLLVGATLVVLATTTRLTTEPRSNARSSTRGMSGTCVEKVTPEEDQSHLAACRVVLACLNDTRCVKTYCQATTIRGGWTLVSPKPESKQR